MLELEGSFFAAGLCFTCLSFWSCMVWGSPWPAKFVALQYGWSAKTTSIANFMRAQQCMHAAKHGACQGRHVLSLYGWVVALFWTGWSSGQGMKCLQGQEVVVRSGFFV